MGEKEIQNVADIIDLEYLQKIQDGLGNLVGVTMVLLDSQGEPISRYTNLNAFCAMMKNNEAGLVLCNKAHKALISENIKTHNPAIKTCPNSGLRVATVPIFLKDKHLASWMIGQVRMADVDQVLVEETAQKAGFSADQAKKNITDIPLITEQEFSDILDFLVTLTAALTDLAEVNTVLDKRSSELQKLADQLDKSSQSFKEFIDLADLGAYLIDYETGELIMCNDMYRKSVFIEEGKTIEGTHCYSHLGLDTFCPFCPRERLLDENGEPGEPYIWENHFEETGQWISITSRALHWTDGRLAIMTTFLDVTDRKNEEQRIAYLAYNDQRLNIPNGVKLHEDLSKLDEPAHLICFDVQGLGKVNDFYGRDSGDRLLKKIVEWFDAQEREDLTLYCVEGDDFVILGPTCSQESMVEVASELHERFDSAWLVGRNGIVQNVYAGAHIGVFSVVQTPESLSALLNTIQRVLAFARKESNLVLFDEETNTALKEQVQFELELKSCVLDNMRGFSLNYQPIIDAGSRKWIGLETLCRWTSPELGIVPPDVFIDAAEQLGLINLLSDWVFDEAISQVKEWKLDTLPNFILDINLSPIQLRDKELVDRVMHIVKKHNYPPEKLSLEITETVEVHFDDETLEVLTRFTDMGIFLALDDFGTGYASFSNLNRLPLDSLKIDCSLVAGIEKDPFLQQTIRSIVDLAQVINLTTVAEGVETKSQYEFMKENGINYMQGYYFSRPLPKEEFKQQIDKFDL